MNAVIEEDGVEVMCIERVFKLVLIFIDIF